jgi:N-acyl-D-amino-acid deacylase
MIDIAIRGAQIVDGTGKNRYVADVGIIDDKIAQIGNVAQGKMEIDGAGLTLAPGFIDPHSHSDFTFHTNPNNESSVQQGVTTEIVGNCGFSSAPLSEVSLPFTEKRLKNYAYTGEVTWRTFGEYLSELERVKTSTNFAFLIGHNSLRLAAGIMGEETVSDDQLKSMKTFIEESMEAGALGMSSGLEFAPGAYSTFEIAIQKSLMQLTNSSISPVQAESVVKFRTSMFAMIPTLPKMPGVALLT